MSQFNNIENVATHIRQELGSKKNILIFAYNGTGKTRLSMEFKEQGKLGEERDTLYFNAFTEDLFSWDNDLDGDSERKLRLNKNSQFFKGLEDLEMETRIRSFMDRYADFDFDIDYKKWEVIFNRSEPNPEYDENSDEVDQERTILNTYIKVSRGEENIFIWCFFLAVVQVAMDKDIEAYSWVKYIYIDDPISSLDENNAVAIGHHLAQLLKDKDNPLRTVISSHHTLFFNVLCNELGRAKKYFLNKNKDSKTYTLKDTTETPFFYHVAMLSLLDQASKSGELYTYHFNILRSILEKTASFLGYNDFSDCITVDDDDPEKRLRKRIIQIFNHGNYSLYEPQEMLQDNKNLFTDILNGFVEKHGFNTELFSELAEIPEEA